MCTVPNNLISYCNIVVNSVCLKQAILVLNCCQIRDFYLKLLFKFILEYLNYEQIYLLKINQMIFLLWPVFCSRVYLNHSGIQAQLHIKILKSVNRNLVSGSHKCELWIRIPRFAFAIGGQRYDYAYVLKNFMCNGLQSK